MHAHPIIPLVLRSWLHNIPFVTTNNTDTNDTNTDTNDGTAVPNCGFMYCSDLSNNCILFNRKIILQPYSRRSFNKATMLTEIRFAKYTVIATLKSLKKMRNAKWFNHR